MQNSVAPAASTAAPDVAPTTAPANASAPSTATAARRQGARAQAQTALADLDNRANLDDAQVKILNEAHKALNAGQVKRAARLAGTLDQNVRQAIQSYTVAAGESLWHIAAQPDVYDNGYLWPLIWQSNKNRIPDPRHLPHPLTLKIRPYPTLSETAEALAYSHQHHLQDAARPGQ